MVPVGVAVAVDHGGPVLAALGSFDFGNSVPEQPDPVGIDLAEVDLGKVEPEISGPGIAAQTDLDLAVCGAAL